LTGANPLNLVISEFAELEVHQIKDTESKFPAGFAYQGVLNKALLIWLDGARPPQKY